MRFTPYLDRIGVTFDEDVPDRVVNILDSALSWVSQGVKWGEYEGAERRPCPENPVLLSGAPIGQYHCPHCGMMVMASMPHLSPEAIWENGQEIFAAYEIEYAQPWPPGYVEQEREAA